MVLGSGWAGYTVARALDSTRYQTVVVSPRSYFAFTPLLASTGKQTKLWIFKGRLTFLDSSGYSGISHGA